MADAELPAAEMPPPAPKTNSEKRRRTPELEAALGARIRVARVAAKMNQSQLGDAVGISFQQVQKYELGKDRIAASTLQGFATALGVHPGSFFDTDAPAPVGRVVDVRATLHIAERIQRIRNPVVLKQLLALADALAEEDSLVADQPEIAGNGA